MRITNPKEAIKPQNYLWLEPLLGSLWNNSIKSGSSQDFTDWHLPTQRARLQIGFAHIYQKLARAFAFICICMTDDTPKGFNFAKLLSVILFKRHCQWFLAHSRGWQWALVPWDNQRWAWGQWKADGSNSLSGYFIKNIKITRNQISFPNKSWFSE